MASSLDLLSAEIDRLIDLCRNLADENAALRREREDWQGERKRLVERNDLARDRIETMIVRLKALEDGR
ncbi:MAG: TIGR02449 family protein [Gammaproteobacteria bacterium]|nr:TIGR02449 family protein [Gammaproteobacteria bacterium]